jgi:hypothetical protein
VVIVLQLEAIFGLQSLAQQLQCPWSSVWCL